MTIGDVSSAKCEPVDLQLTIYEQRDERDISIYVIIQNSEEITSQWTRAGAEHELQLLYAHEAQIRAPRSTGLNTICDDQVEMVARR